MWILRQDVQSLLQKEKIKFIEKKYIYEIQNQEATSVCN